ncbi:hypothetical protein HDV01_004563 [Terramyces sp. JEL0728]|nr:hypothetical protein HDV01_004563 [Terramyces sp. JEL0728]
MKSPIRKSRYPAFLLSVVTCVLVLTKLWTWECPGTVRISTIYAESPNYPSQPVLVYYKLANGSFATGNLTGDTFLDLKAEVDWIFPEKGKGEFITGRKLRNEGAFNALYYKSGRHIYRNTIKGEEKVYELPWCGNAILDLYLSVYNSNTAEFLFIQNNNKE